MKFYTGIGSRETPADILEWMTSLAASLEDMGYTLRSGGAKGADSAFEAGAHHCRIYLPWRGFNNKNGIVVGHVPGLADMARRYHPTWTRLAHGARMLHTRNVAQVLGYSPENQRSAFVICWTAGGRGGGGTGQAIRIAKAHGIRVFDLAIEEDGLALQACMDGLSAFPQ